MACRSARGPLQLRVHAQAWLLAQPGRRLLLEDGALGLASHPGGFEEAELKQRIMAYLDDLNRQPVVHTWSYKITLPAR